MNTFEYIKASVCLSTDGHTAPLREAHENLRVTGAERQPLPEPAHDLAYDGLAKADGEVDRDESKPMEPCSQTRAPAACHAITAHKFVVGPFRQRSPSDQTMVPQHNKPCVNRHLTKTFAETLTGQSGRATKPQPP